jgi:glycosyltransferase involved in cell wall biosynthesis/GT2 family glycosyltransferase
VTSVSVVIPVKDGARYLGEVLDALAREAPDEVLVIDSGSADGSPAIARAAGATLIEIPPAEFGHGRTRNLGARSCSGELICFLTQDATPRPGWLQAYREAFGLDPRVGAAYGPHLPRADTSPMIARELVEFFASFAPDGRPRVQRAGDSSFLSNVNACYARACWEEIGFRDVGYAEDQAFGADLLACGWTKVYHPAAGVLHAHDYGPLEFMRRYFDEYRGLRETTGHVEPLRLRGVLGLVGADLRWMSAQGLAPSERAGWAARSVVHHTGRRLAAPVGSRAGRLPGRVRRGFSLERRDEGTATTTVPTGTPVAPWGGRKEDYMEAALVRARGATALLDPVPGMADAERLRIAMILPPFRRGSGGHNTLLQILTRLERRGHVCSVWVHDVMRMHRSDWPGVLRFNLRDFFAPISSPVYKGFDAWQGADVAIATGWQTVYPALMLDQCRARVYLVNDHEPEFYPASVERTLAEDTYRQGLHCIAASPWLRDLLIERYDASADAFRLGVEHDTYQPRPIARREDTIIYYARQGTPRRAVPTALAALRELHERRPDIRIVLFGDNTPLETAFPYEHLGVCSPEELSWLYSQATVGLCLSLTNFSLMPKEMLACGLPCVELAGVSAESIFGTDGPIELAPLDPYALADALERLLEDRALRERRSREGIAFVASHTWEHATDEVEAGLRAALRLREQVWAR